MAENQEYDPVKVHSELELHSLSDAELEAIKAEAWSEGWDEGQQEGYDSGYDDGFIAGQDNSE